MSDTVENKITLIIEDGTCITDANSYVSLEYADTYMLNTGKTDWVDKTDEEKKAYLINATTYIDRIYGKLGWKGRRKYREQSLCFPRVELYDNDGFEVKGIPTVLKKAVCEASFIGMTSSLFATNDTTGAVKRQKVDVLEVEYFDETETEISFVSQYDILDSLLAGLYKTKNSRSMVKKVIHHDLLGDVI